MAKKIYNYTTDYIEISPLRPKSALFAHSYNVSHAVIWLIGPSDPYNYSHEFTSVNMYVVHEVHYQITACDHIITVWRN